MEAQGLHAGGQRQRSGIDRRAASQRSKPGAWETSVNFLELISLSAGADLSGWLSHTHDRSPNDACSSGILFQREFSPGRFNVSLRSASLDGEHGVVILLGVDCHHHQAYATEHRARCGRRVPHPSRVPFVRAFLLFYIFG